MNNLAQGTKSIPSITMMAALLEVSKIALSAVPNIEVITLLIVAFTLTMGRKTLCAVLVFVGLECLVWGIHLWTVMYLFVWPLLVLLVWLFRKRGNFWLSFLAGIFGLFFGALCAVPYLAIGGLPMAFAWWISGIAWDLVHGVSNFVLCLVLLPRIREVLTWISTK